jgi:hypothetical protein
LINEEEPLLEYRDYESPSYRKDVELNEQLERDYSQ